MYFVLPAYVDKSDWLYVQVHFAVLLFQKTYIYKSWSATELPNLSNIQCKSGSLHLIFWCQHYFLPVVASYYETSTKYVLFAKFIGYGDESSDLVKLFGCIRQKIYSQKMGAVNFHISKSNSLQFFFRYNNFEINEKKTP